MVGSVVNGAISCFKEEEEEKKEGIHPLLMTNISISDYWARATVPYVAKYKGRQLKLQFLHMSTRLCQCASLYLYIGKMGETLAQFFSL